MALVLYGGNPDDVAFGQVGVVFGHPAVAWTDKAKTTRMTGVTVVSGAAAGATISNGTVNGVQYSTDVIYPDEAGVYEFQKEAGAGVVWLEVDGQTRLLRLQGQDINGLLIATGISATSLAGVLTTADLGTNGGSVATLTAGVITPAQATGLTDATAQATANAVSAEVTAARLGAQTLSQTLQNISTLGSGQANASNVVRVYVADNTAPVRPGTAQYVEWISATDPGLQKRDGDRWGHITLSAPTSGGTTTLWNGWDPTSTTSPANITSFYVDAQSTGIPPGTTLTPSGSIHTSANNQVIDALDLGTGSITVDHTGVIIKRCRVGQIIKGTLGNSKTTKIWACEIGSNAGYAGTGVSVFALEMKRCNLRGGLDLYHPTQSSATDLTTVCTIRDNFFHDNALEYDSGQSGTAGTPNSHSDCIQLDCGGAQTVFGYHNIYHNTFYAWSFNGTTRDSSNNVVTAQTCTPAGPGPNWFNNVGAALDFNTGGASATNGRQTSAIILNGTGTGSTVCTNVDIFDNRILGKPGHYIESSASNSDYSGCTVRSNRFGRTPANVGGHAGNYSLGANLLWTGNVYDDDGSVSS